MRALFRFADVVVTDEVVLERDDRRLRYGVRDDGRPVIVEYLAERPRMKIYAWQRIAFDALFRVTTKTAAAFDVDTAPVLVFDPAPALLASQVVEQQAREKGRVPREIVAALAECGCAALGLFNSVDNDLFGIFAAADVEAMILVDLNGRPHARPHIEHNESMQRGLLMLPPEWLQGSQEGRSPATDVYRIGVFLHSLCFGCLPYGSVQDLAAGRRDVVTPTDPLDVLAIACTQPLPASRPPIAYVEGVIRQHQTTVDLLGFARGLLPQTVSALELVREQLAVLQRDAPRLPCTPFNLAPVRRALRYPPPEGLAWDLSPSGDVRDLPG